MGCLSMTPFEAINHSMSLVSTGGFSTSDASLGHWEQPAVHWVAVVIMILGSLPFTLYVATLRGHRGILLKDHQVRGFIGFLVFVWLTVGTWLCLHSNLAWWDAFRIVAVNVTSVVTTTGIAVGDYTLWGSFAIMLFFYLTFVGGCSGSTMRRFENIPFPGGRGLACQQPEAVDPSTGNDLEEIQWAPHR